MYKEKPSKKQTNNKQQQQHQQHNHPAESQPKKAKMSHQSYVEDARDVNDYVPWGHYEGQTEDEKSPAEPLPEAPTPPPAVAEEHVNVWDYMVSKTPNASQTALHQSHSNDDNALVRYDYDVKKYLDSDSRDVMVEYGTGPVPTNAYVTPANKERRRSDAKKDKKRKHLHVDVAADQDMADAPPVLHSGLTGGLKNLLRGGMPPSPTSSSGGRSPASPLKKAKQSRREKESSNGIFDTLLGKNSDKASKEKKSKDKKKSSSRSHRESKDKDDKERQLIPYNGGHSRKSKRDDHNSVVVFKPRADVFLGYVKKDSDHSISINRALKKYHKEREADKDSKSKSKEEKELWRSLRLRRNDRGEIVVCGL